MERQLKTIWLDEKRFDAYAYRKEFDSIDKVIKYFVEAKDKGATHVKWIGKSDFEGDSELCTAQPFYNLLETDKEYQIRIDWENQKKELQAKRIEQEERATYEKLKAKFEK